MSPTEVKVLRAHHIRELYFTYLKWAKVPTQLSAISPTAPDTTHIIYPILVTDSIDDVCRACRSIDICNGTEAQRLKSEDHIDAEILGIEIGAEYSAESLAEIFEAKAKKQGIEPRKTYDWKTDWRALAERFYQKT